MSGARKHSKVGVVLDVVHVYLGVAAVAVGAGMIYLPAGVIVGGALFLGLGLMGGK